MKVENLSQGFGEKESEVYWSCTQIQQIRDVTLLKNT